MQKIMQLLRGNNNQQAQLHRLIYDMFYEKIYSAVQFATNDCHLTDDIVQETFVKALQKLDTVRDPERIGAWLRVIAMNTLANYYRAHNKAQYIEFDETYVDGQSDLQQPSDVENEVELSILKQQIEQKIANLPYIHREVLAMKFIAELSDGEIAEALELNIGTVKSRIHRAKAKLSTEMRNDPEFIGGEMIELS